jgi:hypothetical protein
MAARARAFWREASLNVLVIGRAWLGARRSRRRLANLWLPLQASRQVEEGHLTCPDHRDGKLTFGQYLDERYGTS